MFMFTKQKQVGVFTKQKQVGVFTINEVWLRWMRSRHLLVRWYYINIDNQDYKF